MNRIIKAAEEAVAIAKGEIPAGRIYHNGHWYVPQECLAKARADALEEAAQIVESEAENAVLAAKYDDMDTNADWFCERAAERIRELKGA